MSEPGFDEGPEGWEKEIHDSEHEFKHAMKRMEHDVKQAIRERKHVVKHALKHGAMDFEEAACSAGSGPRSVDEVLVEVDSYISYLEDLPKERLAPYEDKVDRLVEHLNRVRRSLKKDAEAK
jgi:hypothetical protein